MKFVEPNCNLHSLSAYRSFLLMTFIAQLRFFLREWNSVSSFWNHKKLKVETYRKIFIIDVDKNKVDY